MKIMKTATCQDTGVREPDRWNAITFQENCQEVSVPRRGTQAQYNLILKIGCLFWADEKELASARREAEIHVAHKLFGDALHLINDARRAPLCTRP